MTNRTERRIEFRSGDLILEAMLHDGEGQLAAIVMHPHPQFGGDMDNHVVTSICRELASIGATTLRFNTRGTGRSGGEYDHGKGERDDALAAVARLRDVDLDADADLVLVGYSFGATIVASVVDTVRPTAVVLVSPPTHDTHLGGFDAEVRALLITGERDGVSSAPKLATLATPRRNVVVVAGADHGWWPGVDSLCAAISAFVRSL